MRLGPAEVRWGEVEVEVRRVGEETGPAWADFTQASCEGVEARCGGKVAGRNRPGSACRCEHESRSYTRYRSRAGGQQRGLATVSSMNGWIGMSSFSIWPGGERSDI